MASSKNLFLLLGVLFALVFLISSQVAASHDETTESFDGEVGTQGYKGYPGKGGYKGYPRKGKGGGKGGCKYGCCRSYKYSKKCSKCCATAEQAPDAQFEDDVRT